MNQDSTSSILSPTVKAVEAAQLLKHQRGVVCGFSDDCIANKYMSMGVVPGSRVKLVRHASFGSACCLNIDGRVLAVRRDEAACLLIERIADQL